MLQASGLSVDKDDLAANNAAMDEKQKLLLVELGLWRSGNTHAQEETGGGNESSVASNDKDVVSKP